MCIFAVEFLKRTTNVSIMTHIGFTKLKTRTIWIHVKICIHFHNGLLP